MAGGLGIYSCEDSALLRTFSRRILDMDDLESATLPRATRLL